jgi:hypothetical protein
MTLTTSVANMEGQQTYRFASEWQVIVVGNTLFALAYYVPTVASIYCETWLDNFVEKYIINGLYGG